MAEIATVPKSDLDATRAFYDRISRAYDLLADADEREGRERGLQLLDVRPGERVLEVGFGTGQALLALARAVGEDGRVLGIDLSAGMARIARRRLRKAGLVSRVELELAAVPPLPAEDGSFDAAFLAFTLELLPEEVIPSLLGEIRRALAPSGRVVLVALEDRGPHAESLLERTYRWMHRHFPHIVDCRPIELRRLLSEAGFRLEEVVELEIWTLPVAVIRAVPNSDSW